MNTSLVLMSKLVSMMIIAAVGLLTIRIGLLDERDRRQLAKLSLYVLQPCLIVMSFQIELTPERLKGFGLAVVFAALVHLGFIIAAEILERIGLIDAVEELTIIYTNCGNLILPIVSMTLGPEMTFYASAFPISFNVLFWTHGVSRMSGGGFDWRKLVFNSNIIALLTGLLLLLLICGRWLGVPAFPFVPSGLSFPDWRPHQWQQPWLGLWPPRLAGRFPKWSGTL